MKLAVSNIGWQRHDDPAVLSQLRAAGVEGVEVAPTKVWPGWQGASAESARSYRAFLLEQGFAVPALQAILFGKPELSLFAPSDAERRAFVAHVQGVADLAQALGAKVLVFGAPKARRKGDLSEQDALQRAVAVLHELAGVCAERDTCLCIEPNPAAYGCDFVTDAASAVALVSAVDHAGFRLHLDAAALHMAGERLEQVLPRALPYLRHYHISEPFLTGFAQSVVPQAAWLRALAATDYAHWCSIEADAQKHDLAHTLRFVRELQPAHARLA